MESDPFFALCLCLSRRLLAAGRRISLWSAPKQRLPTAGYEEHAPGPYAARILVKIYYGRGVEYEVHSINRYCNRDRNPGQ